MALLRTAGTIATGLVLALGSGLTDMAAARGHPAARLAAEWDPGWSAAEAGGRFTVDGYGVGGLGAYRLALDDGGAALAVCVQADVGHSMTIDYQLDPTPSVASAELDYLLWRMSGPPGIADDLTAAATNVLAWRYAGALRSTGGTIWSGDAIEIAVTGSGRRTDIEAAVVALHAEATRRRGPWQLTELAPTADGTGLMTSVEGPGGPIAGIAVDVAFGCRRWDRVRPSPAGSAPRDHAKAARRLLDQLAQLRVVPVLGEQLPRPPRGRRSGRRVLAGELVRGLELPVLAAEVGIALPVPDHLGVRHLALELGNAAPRRSTSGESIMGALIR